MRWSGCLPSCRRCTARPLGSFQRYDQPRAYGAVVRSGPFPWVLEAIPSALLVVRTALAQGGHGPAGPALVRYGLIAMEGDMTIEIGYPVTAASASGVETSLRLGILPPGRYAGTVVEGPTRGFRRGPQRFLLGGRGPGCAGRRRAPPGTVGPPGRSTMRSARRARRIPPNGGPACPSCSPPRVAPSGEGVLGEFQCRDFDAEKVGRGEVFMAYFSSWVGS